MFKLLLTRIGHVYHDSNIFWVFMHGLTGFLLATISYFTREEILFIGALSLTVIVDTILGSIVALRNKNFNSKKMWGPVYKILVYTLGLGSLHFSCEYFASAQQSVAYAFIPKFIDGVAFSYVLIREMVSIVENGYLLGVYLLPPSIIKRIKKKSDNGL